jgi:hypothetical protein
LTSGARLMEVTDLHDDDVHARDTEPGLPMFP